MWGFPFFSPDYCKYSWKKHSQNHPECFWHIWNHSRKLKKEYHIIMESPAGWHNSNPIYPPRSGNNSFTDRGYKMIPYKSRWTESKYAHKSFPNYSRPLTSIEPFHLLKQPWILFHKALNRLNNLSAVINSGL